MGDLLSELLHALSEGRAYNLNELAANLDVDVELMRQMMGDLTRGGYLQLVGGDCAGACDRCGDAGGCSSSVGGQVWVVTAKGRVAAARGA
ncbi:MAG: FeoC-like transcriptional regulator [Anaerolineae bacterium]